MGKAWLLYMKKGIGRILFLSCLCLPARAQTIAFNHLTVENGLSNNSILAITQDADGFMWLGTRMGLNRYDGSRFKLYKYDSKDTATLSNNDIYSLYGDSKHCLWVGTTTGLDKYDAKNDAFTRIHFKDRSALTTYCIYEDRKGRLWIGTSQGLYLLKDRQKNQFREITEIAFASKVIRCVFEDSKGNLWIGTNNGLIKMTYNGSAARYETFNHEPGKQGTLSSSYITSIAEDARQNIWIGTQNSGVNVSCRPAVRLHLFNTAPATQTASSIII
jgi:ligand-binding sensor domain-containing protein